MKSSIKKIFKGISTSLLLATIFTAIIALLALEQRNAYNIVGNLKNQKIIISSLINLSKDDMELSLIKLNGYSNQLQIEISKLRNLDKFDITGKLLGSSNKFLNNLTKLSALTSTFNKNALAYYTKDTNSDKFKDSHSKLERFIEKILMNNLGYIQEKFNILEKAIYFLFFIILSLAVTYRKKLNQIYRDLRHLYSIDNEKNYEVFSDEVASIKLRMGRKQDDSINPMHIDTLTELYNYKGLISTYSSKKANSSSDIISVVVFEVDNFSKNVQVYSQEFTQAILKKIAFAISLNEQNSDVIARTDYNQFTVILSRSSKEMSFRDADIIRQSISEIKFKEPGGSQVVITFSGGFTIKAKSQNIEDTIKKSKEILEHAKRKTNTISQLKDLIHDEL